MGSLLLQAGLKFDAVYRQTTSSTPSTLAGLRLQQGVIPGMMDDDARSYSSVGSGGSGRGPKPIATRLHRWFWQQL